MVLKSYFYTEVVAESCSVKKMFLEIWQNSQESTCGRVFFSKKMQALGAFPVNFRTPPMAASDTGIFENSFLFYGQS